MFAAGSVARTGRFSGQLDGRSRNPFMIGQVTVFCLSRSTVLASQTTVCVTAAPTTTRDSVTLTGV